MANVPQLPGLAEPDPVSQRRFRRRQPARCPMPTVYQVRVLTTSGAFSSRHFWRSCGTTIQVRSVKIRYREPNKTDWAKSIIYLVLYVAAITIGPFVLLERGVIGPFFLAVIVLGGLLLLVWQHSRTVGYRCANCSHEFQVSLLTDLVSPHGMNWYYLKCPQCGRRTRARVLIKE